MLETKLPRKIIGMNRKPSLNTGYDPESFDEFLHGYKGAWADEARVEQSKWPVALKQDMNFIWPSQVLLYPCFNVADEVNESISFDKIDHVNAASMNCRRLSVLEISKTFSRFPVESKEMRSSSATSSSSELNKVQKLNHVSDKKFTTTHDELKELCLACAGDGERIARIHCYRPFFKKIDGLCDRIKQDLIHHDSVVPHVNSHGIDWAIKDLIFVCTRIINAWNITKCYVYDPSEGLNKVRSSLSADFVQSFVTWQEANLKFIENLMVSFLSLDIWAHTANNTPKRLEYLKKLDNFLQSLPNQKKTYQKGKNGFDYYWEQCGCDPCKFILSSQASRDALFELCITCTEYGEKVAQNYNSRPFFRKIDSLCNRTKLELINCDNALSNLNSQGIVWAIKELIFATTRIINAWNITKGYIYDSSESLDKVRAGLSSHFVPSFNTWQETTKFFVENLKMSFLKLDNLAHVQSNNFKKEDISKQMKVFKNSLQELKSGEVFFRALFCRNYFPDFIAKTPDFKDVRSIINKLQSGGYEHIFEVIHDVRFIIFQVKLYLMKHNDPKLDIAVYTFQRDVDKILSQKTFKNYNFDHIEGRPDENVYSCNYF